MSLLTILQDVALELSLPAPVAVIDSTEELTQQFLALFKREGKELRNKMDWPELSKEHTFTLTSGSASYALPGDFERFLFQTHWDRTNNWELLGPLDAQEWQWRKSGIVTNAPRRRFRFKGFTDTQFFLDPTPGSGDDGDILVYEYQSKNWIRPRTWAQGQIYLTNSYTFYNGNYYMTTAGGTTGATPPTHTTGSMSDGGVIWAYFSGTYENPTADTDETNIPAEAVTLGVKWRFMAAKGLDWEIHKLDYDNAIRRMVSNKRAAPLLDFNMPIGERFLGYNNIPDSGYGS